MAPRRARSAGLALLGAVGAACCLGLRGEAGGFLSPEAGARRLPAAAPFAAGASGLSAALSCAGAAAAQDFGSLGQTVGGFVADNAFGVAAALFALIVVFRPGLVFEGIRQVAEHPRLESKTAANGGRMEAWEEPQCPFGNFTQHIMLGPDGAIERMRVVGKAQNGAFIDYRLTIPSLMIADNDEAVKKLLGAQVTCPAMRSLGDNLPPYKYLFRRALFMNGGDDWMRMQRIASRAMSQTAMELSAGVIEGQVQDAFRRLEVAIHGDGDTSQEEQMQMRKELGVEVAPDGRVVLDPGEFMKNTVLRVLTNVAFGQALDDKDRNSILETFNLFYSESLKPTLVLPGYLDSPIPGGAELKAAIDELHAIGYKFIERERAGTATRPDGQASSGEQTLLSALLFAADEDSGRLNEEEVVHNVYAFIVAGVATTSDSLASSAFMLARHPEVQSRLQTELAGATGWEDVKLNSYLSAVITEQLRLWPPLIGVPPRTMSEDTVLGGISVPKGTDVSIHGLTLHRREKFWGQDAEEFRPERFLENGGGEISRPAMPSPLPDGMPEEAFVAFGGGVRPCIARPLAMIEMKLVISNLVERFDIVETKPDEFGMQVAFPVVFPKRDLRLELRPRRASKACAREPAIAAAA